MNNVYELAMITIIYQLFLCHLIQEFADVDLLLLCVDKQKSLGLNVLHINGLFGFRLNIQSLHPLYVLYKQSIRGNPGIFFIVFHTQILVILFIILFFKLYEEVLYLWMDLAKNM